MGNSNLKEFDNTKNLFNQSQRSINLVDSSEEEKEVPISIISSNKKFAVNKHKRSWRDTDDEEEEVRLNQNYAK